MSRRFAFAHDRLFAGFPPYRFACVIAPIGLVVMLLGIGLSITGNHHKYLSANLLADEHVCASQGNETLAIAACNRLIQVGSLAPKEMGLAYFHKGVNELLLRKFDIAIGDLTTAVGYLPNFSPAYDDRGLAEGREGNFSAEVTDEVSALAIDPKNVYALNDLGRAYLHMGLFSKAVDAENSALAISPASARAYLNRSRAYFLENNCESAIQDLTSALAIDPSNARYYRDRGFCEIKLKQYDNAIKDETAALKIDPSDKLTQKWLRMAEGH